MSKGAIIGASTVLVVAVVAAVCVVSFKNNSGGKSGGEDGQLSMSVKSVKAFCQPTDYPQTCEAELSKAAGNASSPTELAKAFFSVTSEKITKAISESATLNDLKNDKRTSGALQNCKELLEYAVDDLKSSFDKLGGFEMTNFKKAVDDLKTWLSAALTYQDTCLDGFMNTTTTEASAKMRSALNASQELTEDILAVVDQFSDTLGGLSIGRRLLGEDGMPTWVSEGGRHLLEAAPEAPEFKPNVTVAADGSGDFKTINEALAKVPPKSAERYVVYVKAGTYKEYVAVGRPLTNVAMIGDGAEKTIITGNKNFKMNLTTKDTATMEAIGNGFFMKGIKVENTAGAENHQAVALRVQSDQAVFYQCTFDGYQDTLYTHAQRQFFRDCTVTGTIDFIFGNSQVVLQNCLIQPRKPMANQVNIITAQGRREKRSVGGTVLHNCTVEPHPDFKADAGKIATYLARPWKEYSRTLYIQNEIGGFIDPKGWLEWAGTFGLETLFYAEVDNRGPGADMSKRAKWGGIKTVTYEEAQKEFTVETFIQGQQFIPKFGVPFIPGLLPQSQQGRTH
ncbi:probable pectinesterase/pectinesterase inhibitor 21 [Phragmites australis]|uniref:probable pectinesterase/pectinesterase inhibitor 21 n=1 Tax=Phragmites australis TaxID=29695 RepID=UPI002D797742|nr:probable pectinesterase/pectinesterase inhibitor 21 [Phragmites australis]